MLELARRWEVASFVFLSSLPVIGRPLQSPITERHPVDPPSAYHASKLYGERLLELARHGGTPAITLRLSAPVGPGMPDGRIMSVFVRRALAGDPLELSGQGTRAQDYVDVRDVAAAVTASLEKQAEGLLNVASGRCVSNLELARRCVGLLGSTSEVRFTGISDPDEGVRWEVSIQAAREQIGYVPECELEDSIAAVAGELQSGG
jgi:nucleoside-diphosphate-sugar epimerase